MADDINPPTDTIPVTDDTNPPADPVAEDTNPPADPVADDTNPVAAGVLQWLNAIRNLPESPHVSSLILAQSLILSLCIFDYLLD